MKGSFKGPFFILCVLDDDEAARLIREMGGTPPPSLRKDE